MAGFGEQSQRRLLGGNTSSGLSFPPKKSGVAVVAQVSSQKVKLWSFPNRDQTLGSWRRLRFAATGPQSPQGWMPSVESAAWLGASRQGKV